MENIFLIFFQKTVVTHQNQEKMDKNEIGFSTDFLWNTLWESKIDYCNDIGKDCLKNIHKVLIACF